MKTALSVVLVLVIGYLAYLLVMSIREPIEFRKEKDRREARVVERLKQIRTAQEFYRTITGSFAPDFDTLEHVLKTGQFQIVAILGNPDDPTFDRHHLQYDTTYFSAYDSIRAIGINLDSLRYVPFSDGKTFSITADTLTYQQTKVNVVEVGVRRRDFMGPYADIRFSKFDNRYDPNSWIKFGDLNTPNIAGNWER